MIIHQLHHIKSKNKVDFDVQDLTNMGGFRKYMPITSIVFIIAAFALSGLPFTSGYLSKDAILVSVFEWAELHGGFYWLFPLLVSITSWLTTFYIFRVVFKVFFGEFTLHKRLNKTETELHLKDSNAWMKIPVIILALFCFGFFFTLNPFHFEGVWIYQGFNLKVSTVSIYQNLVPIYINVLSLVLIFVAYQAYAKKSFSFNLEQSFLYKLSFNQWYFNQFYDVFLMRFVIFNARCYYWFDQKVIDSFIHLISNSVLTLSKLSAWIDRYIIDGFVNSVALFVSLLGASFRRLQSGKLQHYYIWMLLLFLTFMIFKIII